MPIQLVVCDMDGTLFLKDEVMPAFAGEFSRRLAERGIRFAVATGRSLPMARRFVDALKPTAPCVYANGGADPVAGAGGGGPSGPAGASAGYPG